MERIMFGTKLEKLIKDNNMSIRQFAQKIGVSAKTAQEWVGKSNRFPNSPEILKSISNLFNISIHELLFDEPDPHGIISQILEKTEVHTGLYEITVKKVKTK